MPTPDSAIAAPSLVHPTRMKLEAYSAEIRLSKLTLGVDNIHYDVYLSPRFVEFGRKFIFDLVRQTANVASFHGASRRKAGPPENSAFRKMLAELLQASLTRAKFAQNIEVDLLQRLAVLKFLTAEISDQFSSLLVECKDWIRSRGEIFEHSEQAHVMRSRIAEIQADRKKVFRQVGEVLHHIWKEVEDTALVKSRRALFGGEFLETYDLLKNRFLFVEGGSDDLLLLEDYVLLGNFVHDPDRVETFDVLLVDLVREYVLADDNAEELNKARKTYERLVEQARSLRSEIARLEEEQEEHVKKVGGSDDLFSWRWKRRVATAAEASGEAAEVHRRQATLEKNLEELGPSLESAKQRMEFLTSEYQSRLGDYLNAPDNARRLFDSRASIGEGEAPPEARDRLLQEWVHRLEERDLLIHVLASYALRSIYRDYCPPVHLQQLKKALVLREEAKRVAQILEQFPARKISLKNLDDASRAIRRCPPEDTRKIGLRFAEDLMLLRRDRRNYQHVFACMERINLVRSEHARQLSRANNSLYEVLLPDEEKPKEDPIVSHAVIKADVRGSTRITKDLLARGLNPASHFSMVVHEPVKRLLDRHGAARVFIEGDAIILAIYETESTRATQRAVAKACVLAREILAVVQAYNDRASSGDLPRLELGIGVAFQNSAPSVWMDGDSRIMISRALNLSDRLSSCSKMARRLFAQNPSPFNIFLLQSMMEDASEEEGEELLIRYNMNGIELNEEGFTKLSSEISLAPIGGNFPMPWGKERAQLYFGEVPLSGVIEPIVVRKGFVRQLLPGAKIGEPGARAYYEVCTHPKLLELERKRIAEATLKS
ncbi:MAG: hypothetical protein WBC04_26600 [Candidatus Acidiferrales bacterium]